MLALRINDGGEHCLPLEDIIMQEETKRKKDRALDEVSDTG